MEQRETTGTQLRILRPKQAAKALGISRYTLYFLIRTDPTFPRPRRLAAQAVGWLESDLLDWVTSRPAAGGERGET